MIIFDMEQIMDAKKITEKDLEKKGMNRATLRLLLAGRNTRIDYTVLNQVCKHLNCQPGDLLRYVPEVETEANV